LLGSLGEVAQEGENLLWGQGFGLPITNFAGKFGKKVEVIPERVFFSNSSCGNLEKTWWLGILSWRTSFF
jgi:hypothetical protein